MTKITEHDELSQARQSAYAALESYFRESWSQKLDAEFTLRIRSRDGVPTVMHSGHEKVTQLN